MQIKSRKSFVVSHFLGAKRPNACWHDNHSLIMYVDLFSIMHSRIKILYLFGCATFVLHIKLHYNYGNFDSQYIERGQLNCIHGIKLSSVWTKNIKVPKFTNSEDLPLTNTCFYFQLKTICFAIASFTWWLDVLRSISAVALNLNQSIFPISNHRPQDFVDWRVVINKH